MPLQDKGGRQNVAGGRKHSAGQRLCRDAMLTGVALLLSYLEAILPLTGWLPLPGFRLGWANLAVMLTFYWVGRADAAAVSGVRVVVSNLLFGSATSLLFSFCGAALSYAALWLAGSPLFRRCSMIGRGILSAVGHNVGQLLAAGLLFGAGAVWTYLPFLLVASILFGGTGGWILNACMSRLAPGMNRREGESV